ncbi:unnamed protein product, partial [Auanema sp. JU1783]
MERARQKMMERQQQREQERRSQSPVNLLSIIMIMSIIMSFVSETSAIPHMYCINNTVFVEPDKHNAMMCADSDCFNIKAEELKTQSFKLRAIPGKLMADVRLISPEGTVTIRCKRDQICSKAYLLSRNLIGNPDCWPIGAQISAFILITLVTAISLPLIRFGIQYLRNANVISQARIGWRRTQEIARNIRNLRGSRTSEVEMVTFPSAPPDSPTPPKPARYLAMEREGKTKSPQPLPMVFEEEESREGRSWEENDPTYDQPQPEVEYANMPPQREAKSDPPVPKHGRKLRKSKTFTKLSMMTLIICNLIPIILGCQDAHIRRVSELKCDNRT